MTRSSLVHGAGIALGLAVMGFSAEGSAYCRTASCGTGTNAHTAQVCTPSIDTDCGRPLYWAHPCVTFSVQEQASLEVTYSATETALTDAFKTWMNARCVGGGTPRMRITEAAAAVCDRHEYNQRAGNANVVMYRDSSWPYEGSANTLALTTVTYNLDTGEIYDADMELNSADNHFTTGDTGVDFDLLSIVTHEAGHFLGLAHTPEVSATMYPTYAQHTTNLRELSADDIAGICAIYPPGTVPSTCESTPRHGFSVECAAAQGTSALAAGSTVNACSSGAPRSHDGTPAGAAAILLAASAVVARKRRSARVSTT